MKVLVSFLVGVVVGVIVYIVSTMVPFLDQYAGLLGFIGFIAAAVVHYNYNR